MMDLFNIYKKLPYFVQFIIFNFKAYFIFKRRFKKSIVKKIYKSIIFENKFNNSEIKKNNKLKLINGPIIKKNFLGKKHLGITEYLGSKFNVANNVVMLIYNKNLSVCPLTTHIPLKNVSKTISKKRIINHVKKINNFYKKKFNKKPSFAITGLNPHCECNLKSNEEDKIIKPAIDYLLKERLNISGPYSADTIFLKKNYKKFDVIIGMYHDQVLTPIKTIYEFDAINITLGLPFDRVSPDHGPNLSMFGKNKSNPTSLIRSIEFLSK